MTDRGLPVVDPPAPDTSRPRGGAVVHGVVLAAGTSDRYGDRNKLLASVDGQAMVRRAVQSLRETSLDDVTVVVGHEGQRVRAALDGLDVRVVTNDRYRAGQGTTVAAGVAAVDDAGANAAVVALADMPFVSPSSVDRLLDAYRAGVASAIAAAYEGTRGNPVLFDRRYFGDLAALEGDHGGRGILVNAADAVAVETGDAGVRRDVDHPGDH